MVGVLARLEGKNPILWAFVAFVLVVGIGVLDVVTGYELGFSLFYLLPISLATWFGDRRLGLATSVASAAAWLLADGLTGHPYSHSAIPYWNTGIRFGFFLIVTLLMSALQDALRQEQVLARTDGLTGAVNARFFTELLRVEMVRAERFARPLSLAYMDLDNFKTVNDSLGHSEGDKLLRQIAHKTKTQLRKSDMVARMGGDEFAILLPETDDAQARTVMAKLQTGLLGEMRAHGWSVTFSIGVLTCRVMPKSTDEIIRLADDAMYTAKRGGKNAVTYSTYQG